MCSDSEKIISANTILYMGSKFIAIIREYGEIYFINSTIQTKTAAVHIVPNKKR